LGRGRRIPEVGKFGKPEGIYQSSFLSNHPNLTLPKASLGKFEVF